MEQTSVSPRSRMVAFLLGMFTGFFGGHRFYVGKTGTAILQICTLGGLGLWWLADVVMIAAGEFRDKEGRRLVRWMVDEEFMLHGSQPTQKVLDEMEAMRHEIFELQERVDFMERTLAQVRQQRVPRA